MDTIVTMHTLIIPIPMPSINFFFLSFDYDVFLAIFVTHYLSNLKYL